MNTTTRPAPRLYVAFQPNKRGQICAYRWAGEGRSNIPGTIGRWLRMGLDEARALVAQDLAEAVPYSTWKEAARARWGAATPAAPGSN